ncbi:related to PCL6-cyclin like protein interacting with Pho85p [Serendipita indica DSM 11827]|uniref:Related to PCL6-cyclin like protein interacting with Pho85p n=1 Tax=Serendipita indica (strain DSM 11827) TaxID=1109443 RepID=G4TDT6_SERID|nr:related to PCL6-cyclin like protein interacting with Pho85p [Serendipita indica DSM 11827]
MLAIALPADDNWKSQTPVRPRQSHPSSSVPAPTSSTSSMAAKDIYSHSQPTSAPMAPGMSSNGTVIGPGTSHGVDTVPSGKPLARSKSRGGSVGGFVHGIVNGMQASLRNVGHKSSQTARSQSKSRAYESDGDNHTIASLRHARPGYPPISTTFPSPSSERVAKANGHTHIPLSPLSRESSITQPLSAIATALQSNPPKNTSPSSSPPPSYTIKGPVSRNAARAILELDAIPPQDLLKALALLLEQIAAENDALAAERAARGEEPWEDHLAGVNLQESQGNDLPLSPESPHRTSSTTSRSRSQRRAAPSITPIWDHLTTASRVALSSHSSKLSFHARHIPQISLEAYLMRILKYCPTANATFVAVLVYFDRMCRMADNVENERHAASATEARENEMDSSPQKKKPAFAIDSYNVHRLVIAGVTVASKFFSDVFYTNSRYAKVGGLPQAELNQLELQFLLLNDFELVVPPEELARFAALLISYAQGRGITLRPEGLGKGRLGLEAKIVLGLEPEPLPEPMGPYMRQSPISPSYFGVSSGMMDNQSRGLDAYRARRTSSEVGSNTYGADSNPRSTYSYFQANNSMSDGMDISHDSETEVSTDEDSTIKARSGSESEASEWGVGSTGDEGEGDGDGAETETEGEEDADDDFYDRRNSRRLSSSSTGSQGRTGRARGTPPALERR